MIKTYTVGIKSNYSMKSVKQIKLYKTYSRLENAKYEININKKCII